MQFSHVSFELRLNWNFFSWSYFFEFYSHFSFLLFLHLYVSRFQVDLSFVRRREYSLCFYFRENKKPKRNSDCKKQNDESHTEKNKKCKIIRSKHLRLHTFAAVLQCALKYCENVIKFTKYANLISTKRATTTSLFFFVKK